MWDIVYQSFLIICINQMNEIISGKIAVLAEWPRFRPSRSELFSPQKYTYAWQKKVSHQKHMWPFFLHKNTTRRAWVWWEKVNTLRPLRVKLIAFFQWILHWILNIKLMFNNFPHINKFTTWYSNSEQIMLRKCLFNVLDNKRQIVVICCTVRTRCDQVDLVKNRSLK